MCSKRSRDSDDNTFRNERIKRADSELRRLSLETRNHRHFDINFPFFRQPVEIGSFSLDINRKFENTRQQLKYYVNPRDPGNVNFDLRKGYDTMVRKDESNKEYINDILRWIMKNEEKFVVEGKTEKTKR